MTESKKKSRMLTLPAGRLGKAAFFLEIILSLLIAACAVWFAVSCILIYTDGGESPFTRELVSEHLGRIAPISLFTLLLTVCLGILSYFTEKKKQKNIPIRRKTLLSIMKKKLTRGALSESFIRIEENEKKNRITILSIALSVSAVFAAVALIFILNPSRYSLDEVNLDIAYSVVIGLISTLLITAASFVSIHFMNRSYAREIEAAKAELKLQKSNVSEKSEEINKASELEGHTAVLVRAIIFTVAVAFIISGILNGGMSDVLGKAVRICTECIGLG